MIRHVVKEILRGKTLVRTLMNLELENYTLSGRVLDIGGGDNPSYLRFFKKSSDLEFLGIDLKGQVNSLRLDLETEKLPQSDNSVDKVLLFNIMEHIYNYNFLVAEAYRIIKPAGGVVGFVPFLIGYHPDPRDYFRYTRESLERVFCDVGFTKIEVKALGRGPYLASYNLLMIYWPRFIRLLALPLFWFLDVIIVRIKPALRVKFPLGYLFVLQK